MKHDAGIVRTGRKFAQVLEGARKVFMSDGFEGASVDDIAREAGVSKATLYSYFPDKKLLFMEVATNECARMADQVMGEIDESRPVREALTIAARHITVFLLSDFAQQVFRICVAERDRFPELGRAFYASGPQMGRDRIAEYLRAAAARGALKIDDFEMAAEQFSELCKVKLWTLAVFGIQSQFSEAEIAAVADEAVETFLARFGT